MEKNNAIKYTEKGYQELVDELAYLKGEKTEEVKRNLAQARSYGDLSENSEYDEAKNEQARVADKIATLEELIANAVIINESEIKEDIINLGSTVTVYDYDMEEEIEYSIVGTNEVAPMLGRISDRSPIGSAMMGKGVGEEFTVLSPAGELKFKILKVERTKNTEN